MALLLLQLGAHPLEIAATKLDACLDGGAFFLDFTRPLKKQRWLLAWNDWFGLTMALYVPVVHQGEAAGRYRIAVDRGDPYFAELQRLWAARHPAQRKAPTAIAAPEQVRADFMAQFPGDAAAAAGAG